MRSVIRGFEDWPSGPLHVALGVFDGVHVGHRALIAHLARGARATGAVAVAATFDPLPIQVLAPGAPPSALSDADERCALLREAGADVVALIPFDTAFAALAPEAFVARLTGAGGVRRAVVGSDFRFGHDRAGDVGLLRELGRRSGFEVDEFPPLAAGGRVVSSTRIRNALRAGEAELAAALLGRPYAVRGTVVHGERRGRGLGYPTINIETLPERLLPKDGIYAMWIDVAGGRHRAAASLGLRPTFGSGPRRLEAFLLDFSGELYGANVRAAFVLRLRDELYFEGPEALAAQIAKDVEAARQALPDRGEELSGG
jgi:riboflavin kinase/FMN adenylyltransferase